MLAKRKEGARMVAAPTSACVLFVTCFFSACSGPEGETPEITFEPYEFVAADGTKVDAERGAFRVPENRSDPDGREIELGFVRFRATSDDPASPIVYLAGGPGGSGVATARGRRFPLFMAMREFGDVIAFDQRGTGWSNPIPECETEHGFPLDEPLRVEKSSALLREAADECADFWRGRGVDLAGYNTAESARDIDALRRALGADQVTLWGISYGSHLTLAALKSMGAHVDRVVLAGIEGLDHTVKLPGRTDAYFSRLQEAIDQDPAAAEAYPDLAGLMQRVHRKLEESPLEVTFSGESGQTVTMVIGKTEMQMVASASIADPSGAARLPAVYTMVDAGDGSQIAPLIYDFFRRDPISFRGMPEAMDIMSGVSPGRLAAVREQAETSLLGDMLNFPMPHLVGAFGLDDLGDDFRTEVESDVPALILTGTLDGRTYPEGAAEVLSGLPNATQVLIRNGGHNVYMQSPKIGDIVIDFMRGEDVPAQVTLDPPEFIR